MNATARGPTNRDEPVLLVVDDEEDFRTSFSQVLQEALGPATVLSEADPATALEQVEAVRVDLVVVDFRLRKMNGLEFVRRVKKVSPATLTVILTAFPGQFLRELVGRGPSATQAMDLCLAKTEHVGELVERLKSLLHEPSPAQSLFPDLDRIDRARSTTA